MEPLKHECGIAYVRLRKPLQHYIDRYGTFLYGLNKLYLLMEKQHNRGQDGAGLAVIKQAAPVGEEYLFRERAEGSNAITTIFARVHKEIAKFSSEELQKTKILEENVPFIGECYMGHLRYSTTGRSGINFIHPMMRRSNWRAKSLAACGNFNLTNVDGIFREITSVGQHPRLTSDTHVLLEQTGHRLDREIERLYQIAKKSGLEGMDITHFIEARVDLANVLKSSAPLWDGGFVMCGVTGSGDSYVLRDRNGIRPAFYYIDDEIIVVASERPVIQTVMDVRSEQITELKPGEALLINQRAEYSLQQILEPGCLKSCSFERIYFSRGSDKDIYNERKELGRSLLPQILKEVDYDLDHTVFSYIPNTAEVAYYGMLEGANEHLNQVKGQEILSLPSPLDQNKVAQILNRSVRSEKVAIKDIKLRTFIAEGNSRNDLAAHVYDITYGTIQRGVDNLVVIDDSIVRGTTLQQSILKILDRLGPRKIVVVSSSPQIRYPDCYGINMSEMKEFIAFRAAVALLEERGMQSVIFEAYKEALELRKIDKTQFIPNVVKTIYAPFSTEEISSTMVRLLKSKEVNADVSIVFQSIEGLHKAIPNHPGDWYFTGDYPTPGGSHIVNEAFINFVEKEYNGAV